MTIAEQLIAIFRKLDGQAIRLMQLRRMLQPQLAESAVRKIIYELEAQGLLSRENVPKKDGLCYKVLTKQ